MQSSKLIDNIIRSVGNTPSTNLGPAPAGLVADWMNARLAGKPFASERWLVEANGNVVKTPYSLGESPSMTTQADPP